MDDKFLRRDKAGILASPKRRIYHYKRLHWGNQRVAYSHLNLIRFESCKFDEEES